LRKIRKVLHLRIKPVGFRSQGARTGESMMPLQVIGAGFGRTGTMSLKMALEELGLGPCHHMIEVIRSSEQIDFWEQAARNAAANGVGAMNWEDALSDYGSAVDWPTAHYWRELADAYPDAKIILSHRSPEGWWASFSETILKALEGRDHMPTADLRRNMTSVHDVIVNQTLGGQTDRESALAAFARRIEDVRAAIPTERLLMYDVREGWEPLCSFLGRPVPGTPFPRSNSRDEFWEHTKGN
jgi:hypothetical protein